MTSSGTVFLHLKQYSSRIIFVKQYFEGDEMLRKQVVRLEYLTATKEV